jgi:F0F1-type ATP synthase membrane subunit a
VRQLVWIPAGQPTLAFRLFGSVFAGHVLVSTMLAIAPVVIFHLGFLVQEF